MPSGKYIRTVETRKKISESKKGEKHPMYGKHPTTETLRKRSESMKGKNTWMKGTLHTEEWKQNMSERIKMEKHPMFGKHHTEESKRKNREAHIGRHHSEESRQKNKEWSIKHPNRKFSNTSIEKKIAAELTDRKIPFKQNVGVEKIANVDFLLGGKIIIQCDGCYYHECKLHGKGKHKDKKIKDKKQDKQLKKLGYKIYRLWEHDINKSPEKCINKINNK